MILMTKIKNMITTILKLKTYNNQVLPDKN